MTDGLHVIFTGSADDLHGGLAGWRTIAPPGGTSSRRGSARVAGDGSGGDVDFRDVPAGHQ